MQMEREIRNRNQNQNLNGLGLGIYNHDNDALDCNGRYPASSPASASASASASAAVGFIEHAVSKLDTLAGVAIKYGVEVADIKKMNGLVTDLQMFALKSIQIPLPGRHPPSPCLSNGSSTPGPSSSDRNSSHRLHRDLFDSFQTLRVKSSQRQISPAMSSLQGYYGLKSANRNSSSESSEMAAYGKGILNYLEDSGVPDPNFVNHRKSKSLINGYSDENGETDGTTPVSDPRDGETDKWSDKLIRRRQKSEVDFSRTPEKLLEDNSGNNAGFSAITGKQLAMRPKSGGRIANDAEFSGLNPIPVGLGDSFITDGFSGVRKSSSTPSLQDPESNTCISSRSASKWSLKSDIQGFSTSVISKPIFDGLPKPITGRRSKAALD